jgi:subtilisin family serine protease
MLPSGEEIIVPGPDDEVRVIILLGGEPVSKYKSRLPAATVRPAQAEQGRIRSYADGLRASHRRLLAEIEAQGITLEVRREYSYLLNGLAVSTKMGNLKRIEALPGVRGVYPDYEVCASLEDSVPLIGADQVWTMLDPGGQPVTGEGIRVAIIDSGIDYNHPDLGGGFGPGYKVLDGYDFYNDDDDPMDDHYHGTHCAGIVAADGAVKGVAPGAILYAYKVFCSTG